MCLTVRNKKTHGILAYRYQIYARLRHMCRFVFYEICTCIIYDFFKKVNFKKGFAKNYRMITSFFFARVMAVYSHCLPSSKKPLSSMTTT